MNQEISIHQRCHQENHEFGLFIKICTNENCNNPRLCRQCFESGLHQQHENYKSNQIINISDFTDDLDKYIRREKEYQDQLYELKMQAKYIQQDIKIMFENFINNIREEKNKQTKHIINSQSLQNSMEKKIYYQDKIQKVLEQIKKYVHDELELRQSVDEIVKSYKMKKFEKSIFQDQGLLYDKLSNINDIKEYRYKLNYFKVDNFNKIQSLDVSKTQKYVAVAVETNYFVIYETKTFKKIKYYVHGCQITSIKFSSDSIYVYFGDSEGYINIFSIVFDDVKLQIHAYFNRIDSIFLVSYAFILTVSSKNQSIMLVDITEEEKSSEQVCKYSFQQQCNIAYCIFKKNVIYPSGNYICVHDVFQKEPFIRQNLKLKDNLPLQLEISQYGNQLLTHQDSEIICWSIDMELKQIKITNIIKQNNKILNLQFVFNDQFIYYDQVDCIEIVQIDPKQTIKSIKVDYGSQEEQYQLKQPNNVNNIWLVRNNKVIIFQKVI